MNVADAMTPRSELVVAELPGTRDDALEQMQEHGFSSVPIVKQDGEEVYRGLVSRQDLIVNPDEDQLAMLMRDVPTASADQTVVEAAALMIEEGARRLPVVNGGTLKGIFTVTDVIRAVARGEADGDSEVGDIVGEDVNATYVETPLPVAEREIGLANVPYSIVLDEEASMTGIITEVDILDVARVVQGEEETGESLAEEDSEWAWEGIKAVGNRYLPTRNVEIPTGPVREFMSDDLVTVGRRRSAREVAQEMISHDVEQIPVVSGGDLVSVVRDVDIVRAI